MSADKPTADQLAALQRFARTRGHYWRGQLRRMWERSEYHNVPEGDHALLQQVRNNIGPSGLARVRLDAVDATAYIKAHTAEKRRLLAPGIEWGVKQKALRAAQHSASLAMGDRWVRCATCRGNGAVGSDYCYDCPAKCRDGAVYIPPASEEKRAELAARVAEINAELLELCASVPASVSLPKFERGAVVISLGGKLPPGTLGVLLTVKASNYGDGNVAGVLLGTGEVAWVGADRVEVALGVADDDRNDLLVAFAKNNEEYNKRRASDGR